MNSSGKISMMERKNSYLTWIEIISMSLDNVKVLREYFEEFIRSKVGNPTVE